MTITVLSAFLLVLILPFMFSDFRKSLLQAAVLENVTPSIEDMDGLGLRTNTRYCWFEIHQLGRNMIAEISVERYQMLKEALTPATVIITKLPFCAPKIESVKWQDESSFEAADKTPKGVYAAILYFFAGIGFLVWSVELGQGVASQLASYGCMAFWVFSGYAAMLAKFAEFKASDLRNAPVKLIGVKVGSGKIGFAAMAFICLIASIYLFASPSIFTFFFGIHSAMALGSFAFLMLKS